MRSLAQFVVAASIIVSGCAAAGTQVKDSQLQQFMPGQTTYQQVVAALGAPNANTTNFDGSRSIVYVYTKTTVRAETFIPIVGGFVGGADSMTNSVVLRFGKDGLLQDYSTSTGQVGAGTGFAAGNQAQRTGEPKRAP